LRQVFQRPTFATHLQIKMSMAANKVDFKREITEQLQTTVEMGNTDLIGRESIVGSGFHSPLC
jgi:hypothetical protein